MFKFGGCVMSGQCSCYCKGFGGGRRQIHGKEERRNGVGDVLVRQPCSDGFDDDVMLSLDQIEFILEEVCLNTHSEKILQSMAACGVDTAEQVMI